MTVPTSDTPEARLNRWLEQRGLSENPFAVWNAERELELAGYFVDAGHFDELLNAPEPCVVFAGRGCGKTAQRKMLAAQCRPQDQHSARLAVSYTAGSFERALNEAHGDVHQVRSSHHVKALLHLAVTALMKDLAAGGDKQAAAFSGPDAQALVAAYLAGFAPHLHTTPFAAATPAVLDMTDWQALLQGFAELLQLAKLESCVVLVDGLDELPAISGEPAKMAFLASLLGMLPLIECPGWAFKFFLPEELRPAVCAEPWFRPDRLRQFPIRWEAKGLSVLIRQRLSYFSQKEPPCRSLAQLSEDKLAGVVDDELTRLANGQPRGALYLANLLLQRHCQARRPLDLIQLKTWEQVQAEWQTRRADFPGADISAADQKPATKAPAAGAFPILQIDEQGNIRLGKRDITRRFNPKEYRVLACLYRHRGGICKKETLVEEAWRGEDAKGVSDQAIAASAARLRRILEDLAPGARYIETVKSIGYRLYPEGYVAEDNEP